jgi:hypothetical protein
MNDVGWNIEAGNYQRYLRQYDPNGTSRGYWRQGPKDQPYGRFARAFDVQAGKKAMYFDLDDRFFTSPAGPHAVTLRVVYLDSGSGAFEVRYDGDRVAAIVTKTGTGRWKEASAKLPDARLSNLGPHHTDVELRHTSGDDTLFHLVEITRTQ